MKPFFRTLPAAVILAGLVMMAVNIYTAGRTVRMADREAVRQMEETGAYLAGRTDFLDMVNADTLDPVYRRARHILFTTTRLSGLERITITDSLFRLQIASSNIFVPGDNFKPYLIDTLLARRAVAQNRPLTTLIKRIEGELFRSCYYPVSSETGTWLIVLEADRKYFTGVSRIRRNLLWSAVLQFALLLALAITLWLLYLRYQTIARRNSRQEKLAFLGQTASELAHEIKNPLAIIKSSADVLQRRFDPLKSNSAFGFIGSETMRISRLIDDILNFGSDRKLSPVWFGPHQIAQEITGASASEWPGIRYLFEPGFGFFEINADPDRFRQVLWNLIKNAAEAMHGNGEVRLSLVEKTPNLIFTLSDTGPGISESVLPAVFQPFVSEKKHGTGLGLSVAAAICERHGFAISAANNADGTGARMEIQIPEKSWRRC